MSRVSSTIPHSAFRIPLSRRALTLAEVLIAMGLLTLGLLGVAAVFPVGGYYMQSGDIADRGNAIAQAALEDAIIRGYLDPKNWVLHDASRGANTACKFVHFIDGWREGAQVWPGLREGLSNLAYFYAGVTTIPGAALSVFGESQRDTATPERYTSKLLGGAFAIDPIGLAATLSSNSPPTTNDFNTAVGRAQTSTPVRGFPAVLPDETDRDVWRDFFVNVYQWPVRRVTPIHTAAALNATGTYWQQLARAQQLFSAGDDLALMLPDDNDAPAEGMWEVLDAAGRPAAARLSNRDYSWLLTVAPGSSTALNSFATKPDAYPVEVSSVVFHKRAVGAGNQSRLESERAVNADVIQSGTSGGELLLYKRAADTVSTSPFDGLRTGHYVMVFGPHPLSNAQKPMLALRWCRVLSIEKQGPLKVGTETVQLNGVDRVLVSLRGPDWPWTGTGTPVARNLRVAIVPGVVAVHTKTMRLESATEWSIR